MRSRGYSTEGLVLFKKNHGEADRIIVVYSKHFGQLRLIAKGVRKLKSRKRGHLEVFSHIKFSANRGKGLDIITEVETINSYENLRKDLKRSSVGYYLCEILGKLTREGEASNKIFADSVEFLDELGVAKNLKSFRQKFAVRLLTELGFWSDGTVMDDPDKFLEDITERSVNTIRVAKAILT